MPKPKKDPEQTAPEAAGAPAKPRVTFVTAHGGLTVDGVAVAQEPAVTSEPTITESNATESGDPADA